MSRNVIRRASGSLLVLIGAFLVVVGVLTPVYGDIDLDLSGEIMVGLMYALIGAVFLVPGVALLRSRTKDRTG